MTENFSFKEGDRVAHDSGFEGEVIRLTLLGNQTLRAVMSKSGEVRIFRANTLRSV